MDFEEIARTQYEESEILDFKSNFEPSKPGFWCEIIKDIVAFANSRGGVIVFGLDSDGKPALGDCNAAAATDVSQISNQVTKYTTINIGSIRKFTVSREGLTYWCVSCDPERVLIPFVKPGTYEPTKGDAKSAFSVGQIYARHGSKSEPMMRDDLRAWIDRELEKVRGEWLANIRKVVDAPVGHTVVVSTLSVDKGASIPSIAARLSNDPNAIPVRLQDPKTTWPYRSTDIKVKFGNAFPNKNFNSHDLVAIRHTHHINETTRPEMMVKTHPTAGPQYSDIFFDWLLQKCSQDDAFLEDARSKWRADTYPV